VWEKLWELSSVRGPPVEGVKVSRPCCIGRPKGVSDGWDDLAVSDLFGQQMVVAYGSCP
jgi:hypothetical protein